MIRGLPESSEPRQGYDAAAAGIGPGVLGPTMLVLEGPGHRRAREQLASSGRPRTGAGVAGVLGPADQPLPSRAGVMLAPNGNAARYVLVLDGDPDGAGAIGCALRARSRPAGACSSAAASAGRTTGVTGDTTIASELSEDTTGPPSSGWRRRRCWCCCSCSGCCCAAGAAPLYLVGSQPARRRRRARPHGLRLPGPARLRRAGLLRAGRERDPAAGPGRRLQRLPDQPHLARGRASRSCGRRSAPPAPRPAGRSPSPASSSPSPSPPWP